MKKYLPLFLFKATSLAGKCEAPIFLCRLACFKWQESVSFYIEDRFKHSRSGCSASEDFLWR